ncbi:hypothetical protein DPMN_144157 [Dreissena polymorpha]|uniref:Uncharacterized protein n=1 Tax=Dreissena polymorpha TaxID=45954 RepID=A0A9D4JMB2_DREPO|nr:hypothetical protein DPMN_144157 [Dreissena polymorpha]
MWDDDTEIIRQSGLFGLLRVAHPWGETSVLSNSPFSFSSDGRDDHLPLACTREKSCTKSHA